MLSVVPEGDLGEPFLLSPCEEMPVMEDYRAGPIK